MDDRAGQSLGFEDRRRVEGLTPPARGRGRLLGPGPGSRVPTGHRPAGGSRARSRLAALAVLVCSCAGCSQGDRAVPFKLGAARAPGAAKNATPAAGATPAGPGQASSYPAGTAEIELDGRSLKLAAGSVRGALALAAQAGAPPGLLVLLQDPGGALSLARAGADGDTRWASPEPVVPLQEAGTSETCSARSASLGALDAARALIDLELDCTAGPAPGAPGAAPHAPPPAPAPQQAPPAPAPAALPAPSSPPAPSTAAPQQPARLPPPTPANPTPAAAAGAAPAATAATHGERQLWVVTREPQPRVLEHLTALAPQSPDEPKVTPALQSRDLDGDGNPDLLLSLEVAAAGTAPTQLEVELYSRAGGLARDPAEPEKTLRALADRAAAKRRSDPAGAGELARQALLVHRALCRESGAARLQLGVGRGLDCGPSLGAGRAASVLVAVLAAGGKLLQAVERYQMLDAPAYRLTDNDRERARYALQSRVDAQSYGWKPGPQLELPPGPRVQRAPCAFVDEDHLLLRGTRARSYDLRNGTLEPTGIPAQTAITDPSGRYAVSAVVRACDGYHLGIVLASQLVAGVSTGRNVSEPLFAPAEPPPQAGCPELTREQRADQDGYRVLDWTSAGVLIAHADTLLLLPLDASANAHGPARVLGPDDTLPALNQSAELTADGRYLALLTSVGIAIHDRKQGSTKLIAVPAGTGTVSDIALSPSGKLLAVVRGGRLLLGVPRAPQAPAPGAPTSATPLAPPARHEPPAP